MRLVGYCRVSTDEQGASGLGLDAQELAIREAVARRGDVLVDVIREVGSGGKEDRAGFEAALAMCGTDADGIVVAKLDRATRSLAHFSRIMQTARKRGIAFVALDLGVDTSTAAGELLANVMASVAQWERQVISERTRAAWAAKKARGDVMPTKPGAPPEVVERIVAMRQTGATLRAICEALNDDGVPTAQGGKAWLPNTVQKICRRHGALTPKQQARAA